MSHFKAVQSREDFQLASGWKLSGTVAQYLRGFQLEGVKFIADHLLNSSTCILNDQSGLGKTAVVVAFFSALGGSKRAVIIVNDESNVLHWQYHFEKLASVYVGTIDEEGASTKEGIQIIRWSTLVNNPRILQKYNFQILILDNRGNCLSNKICESFLLKNFERKVQLLIASEDLTSDLNLLYTSLKLIGRLDKKYEKKSVFVDRFSLPEVQDKLLLEKDFLEDYFMLRNIIRDYCGSYRLRRYVHQYEQFMPLTNKMDFEKHFQNWLGIGNNSNSMLSSNGNISSQDSVKIISSNSSTNTNELFETLFLAPKSQEIFQNAQSMGFLDHEEDVMPPLMFEDESDTEQSEKQPTSSEKPIKKEQSKKVETKNKKIETKNKKVETKNNKTAEKHTKTLEKNTKTVDKDEIKRRKLAKMLEIDFTSKYQVNKSILKEVEREMVSRERKVSSDKEKPVIVKKEVKRLSPVKMLLPIREPKLKEKPVNKQLEKLKKLLDIDCTPKHQFNKNVLDDVVKQEEEDEENRKKVSKKKVDQKKQRTEKEKEKDKKKPKEIEKKERKSPSLDELKRKKLERLLQIDFTPKYQLNNLSRKLAKAAKSRDLKKVIPKERKRAKDREQNTPSQNAQKFVESASPDTTTQDFISPRTSIVNSNELLHLDIDGELEKLKDSLNEVVVEEEPETDVIDLIDDSDEDDDDFVKSPDIFGGRMDELITDDESINCSQTLPTPRTQIPSTIKPAKPKKSQSCLQQLESQDLSTDGNNFMDVYSDFLQAQKSNESSPYKTTQNNKPTATGNKITKYFGGASSAMQAREILKTPTRRKSFSGVRRSPKTPPNIQNNNIMTWLVRPSSSSSADHQDSSITSSIKDVKRRRLDY